MRSLFSSSFRAFCYAPSTSFSTSAPVFVASASTVGVSSTYTTRNLRTFRALRILRSRRTNDASALRLVFLLGGDKLNIRRAIRQVLRPLLLSLLPGCEVAFSFRPSGVALRHPNLGSISLGYSRRLHVGALIERELSISGSTPNSKAHALSSLAPTIAQVVSSLNGLGRRPLQSSPPSISSSFSSSTSAFHFRLFKVFFPNSTAVITRREEQLAAFLQVSSPSTFSPSSAFLEPAKLRDSVARSLLFQRENSTLGSIGLCLAPPYPFLSILSLLERRCHSLQTPKLVF